jgi:uncharacterized protein (DUF2384 family)
MGDELKRQLLEFYTPAEAFEWLFAPHPQLNGTSAINAISASRGDEVLAILQRLGDGSYL